MQNLEVKKFFFFLRIIYVNCYNAISLLSKFSSKISERQEEATVKRIKLEYDELSSCKRELIEVWDLLVSKESRVSTKCDNQMLLHAIKQGN